MLFLLELLFFVGNSFCADSKNQLIVTFMSSAILIMDFHKNDMRESRKINVRCIDSTLMKDSINSLLVYPPTTPPPNHHQLVLEMNRRGQTDCIAGMTFYIIHHFDEHWMDFLVTIVRNNPVLCASIVITYSASCALLSRSLRIFWRVPVRPLHKRDTRKPVCW